MSDCEAVGSLIVPIWKSTYFWPLPWCSNGAHLNFFMRDWLFLPNKSDLFIKGKAKNKLFGTKAFKSRCLTLRIDFAGNNRCSSLGFWTFPVAIIWLANQVCPKVSMVIQIMTHWKPHLSSRFLTEFLLCVVLLFNTHFGYSLGVYSGGDCADLFCGHP